MNMSPLKVQPVLSTLWGGGQRKSTGLLVGVKYGGDFVGPKAATVAIKALQEP
jgi:hypothetical protein